MKRARVVEPTPFGPVGIVWSEAPGGARIVRVLLSRPGLSAAVLLDGLYPGVPRASCPGIEAVAASIREFLEGGDIRFPLPLVDFGGCSAFQRDVLRIERRIPRGSVSTYGLIASSLGRPGGARAVGRALASNPFPILIPCHRAIRSDGGLGGFQGGLEMKRALLRNEGVLADEAGRVVHPRIHRP